VFDGRDVGCGETGVAVLTAARKAGPVRVRLGQVRSTKANEKANRLHQSTNSTHDAEALGRRNGRGEGWVLIEKTLEMT
jgi:hypothetical protein